MRADVWITNVVKARPAEEPRPEGARGRALDAVPRARDRADRSRGSIVPLGRHALKHFAPVAKIGEVHGTLRRRAAVPALPPGGGDVQPDAARRRCSRTPGRWASACGSRSRGHALAGRGRCVLSCSPRPALAQGAKPQTEVAGLRGAARLAAALAAERDVGDAALAALRRDAAVLAARRHPRRHLALAARRHPQPRGPGRAARLRTRTSSARELVAPWQGKTARAAAAWRCCESRALRTLTQGHLSQHMFFHSLHQDAIPDAAPEIFGTSTTRFRDLRRSELSPLMICRLNGLSRAHAQDAAETDAARRWSRAACAGRRCPASQGERLLARQLRQVPRWLQQTRYNGPPPLKQPRGSIATASNYSNNAALAADGRALVWEGYEAKLAMAKARGEIGVVAGSLRRRRAGAADRRRAHARRARPTTRRSRRRALRRLRVRRGQPQLRQALRADARLRDRPRDRPDASSASLGDRLRARPPLGLQPVAVGGRARRRLRDLRVRARRARRLGDATCAPSARAAHPARRPA